MNEISVPGKGELFWRELSQRCDGSRLAQESVGPQKYDGVGQQSHDPSQMEASEKEAS